MATVQEGLAPSSLSEHLSIPQLTPGMFTVAQALGQEDQAQAGHCHWWGLRREQVWWSAPHTTGDREPLSPDSGQF